MTSPSEDASDADRTPLWVRIVGGLIALLLLAFVVLALVDGGHGPSRHAPSLLAGGLLR